MEGKEQDPHLMAAILEYIRDALVDRGTVAGAIKVHDRSIQVAFPDGRVVTLVLYGPRRGGG